MKTITVYEKEVKRPLGDLFGLFFEDLNHAADGGMYAELVQNRSFEYCKVDNPEYHALTAWEKSGGCVWEIRTEDPLHPENLHYLHVKAGTGDWIANSGYNTGIFVEEGKSYRFSLWARCAQEAGVGLETAAESGGRPVAAKGGVTLEVAVKTAKGECTCAAGLLAVEGRKWKKYELTLKASQTTWEGRLYLTFPEGGDCELDMVSLFPEETFCGRENGMRADIAQALREMKPKFLRFPGGCLTHTGSLDENARDSMYRWKKTIGPLQERPARRNNWGYNQSFGIGYYEYFLFCEDIGAKPLPVLPGGFNPHTGEGAPLSELGSWVQEALDLIEFANGGRDTAWGKIRAELGHEKPFGLEYIAIGNEEIGDGFFERYPYFHQAIREKYPEIKIINSAGPFAVGEGYEAGWASARRWGSDLIDEHYYSSPEWFLANMHHYEDYDEKGPKVFLGEYASWGNTYYNALVEAAYMTHLERSKAVGLACYAPMLCNVDYVNWKPDMLWFDNHRILKTPNYYVQKLFMEYQGTQEVAFETKELDEVLPLMEKDRLFGEIAIAGNDVQGRVFDLSVADGESGSAEHFPDFIVDCGNAEHMIRRVDDQHFVLEFSFQRTAGRKGLKITFGRTDAKNYLQWEFGGWDNWDCNVNAVENGRSSVISHRIFHVEEKEYRLKLEVEGCHIRTWVNGEPFNDTVYRLPELEELYVAASKDEDSGRTIVKAVNLTGEEKRVLVRLDGEPKKTAKAICLKGHSLGEENTFEEPDKITPVEEDVEVSGNEAEYVFGPHSFVVLLFE